MDRPGGHFVVDEGVASSSASTSRDGRPAIVVVDGDELSLARLDAELQRRYADAYDVILCRTAAQAQHAFTDLVAAGAHLALVLVASPGIVGAVDVLARAEAAHPSSKRALLVEFGAWGDPEVARSIRQGIASGEADYYVLKPWRPGDELFHRTVTEFLYEFSRTNPTAEPREFVVIADRWSPRGHELRQLLARNGIPHVHYDATSPEAASLLERHGATAERPSVVTPRGELLVEPSDADLARQYGVTTALQDRDEFDLVVIGAGPGGLASAISAAAEGLSVLVVEREGIGGQASTSSRIRNYLGFSRGVSGAELAQRAYQQAWAFGVEFLHMCDVTGLRTDDDGRYVVELGDASTVRAPAVLLAMGVSYRRLDIPAVEDLLGRGVFYGASVSEARSLAGAEVYVIGGGNSAGQAALHLARAACNVTIVTRKPTLGSTMSQYLRDEIGGVANIAVRYRCTVVDGGGDSHLEWLVLEHDDGTTEQLAADAVFLFIGGMPRTAWLPPMIARDPSGFVLTGNDLPPGERRGGSLFETSAPGVFAVGDVRSGSVKRVASAVGEGSIVVPHIVAHVASGATSPEKVEA